MQSPHLQKIDGIKYYWSSKCFDFVGDLVCVWIGVCKIDFEVTWFCKLDFDQKWIYYNVIYIWEPLA